MVGYSVAPSAFASVNRTIFMSGNLVNDTCILFRSNACDYVDLGDLIFQYTNFEIVYLLNREKLLKRNKKSVYCMNLQKKSDECFALSSYRNNFWLGCRGVI